MSLPVVQNQGKKYQARKQKVKAFVREYLRDFNATRAVLAIGFTGKNPGQAGYDFLKMPETQELYQREVIKQQERRAINTNHVLAQLDNIAFSDTRLLFDENGNLKPPDQWDDATAASIAAIETETEFHEGEPVTRVTRIRRHDRLKALDMLARHKSLYNDIVKVEGLEGIAERLNKARAEEEAKERGGEE